MSEKKEKNEAVPDEGWQFSLNSPNTSPLRPAPPKGSGGATAQNSANVKKESEPKQDKKG